MPFRRGVESVARCKYQYIPPLFKKLENIDLARRVDPMNFASKKEKSHKRLFLFVGTLFF